MRQSFFVLVALGLVSVLVGSSGTVLGQVSNTGLLAEYRYETSGGVPVTDGASAAGQIDDTGLLPKIHAVGSGGDLAGLTYSTDVPLNIGSSFSLSFPSPENADNFVRIPMFEGDALTSITVENFRVETWFKTTDPGRSNLVSSYVGPRTALNLELHTSNRGRIYVQGPSETTDLNLTLPTTYSDGQWHHLAGVRSENTVELYYDFELVGSAPDVAGSYTMNKPDFFLGMDGRASGTPRFQGALDDVRIYNSADPSSLIAEYLFETIEGAPVFDGQSAGDQIDDTADVGPFHGEGSAGTVLSTPIYVADAPEVLSSSMYSLAVDEQAASVEYGRIPVVPELAEITQGDFALETWFKTTDTGRSILMGGWNSGPDTVNLELHTDNRVRIYVDGPDITDLNRTAPGGINTRDGEWHHLVGQREDDMVSLFLDGEFVDVMADVAGPFSMQVNEMFLGRDSRTDSTRFDGQLDDTRIWSRAMTPEEIATLAAGASPVGSANPDFNNDGNVDVVDVDALVGGIVAGTDDGVYDLDGNGSVNTDDLSQWLAEAAILNGFAGPYISGDANLDGTVDPVDLNQLGIHWLTNTSAWSAGDFTADGSIDASDLNQIALSWRDTTPEAATAIPEPSGALLIMIVGILVPLNSRRQHQAVLCSAVTRRRPLAR